MFRDYLEEQFGIQDEKIEYLPQYAEGLFEKLPIKNAEGRDIDLVFAVTIGKIQGVEMIIKAAEKLKDKPVHFHIIGRGTDLKRLQGLASDLNNITFYGRHPLEEMPKFLAKADAMLLTLKADPVLSLTFPGKVQSYMAVVKPIIGAIDVETAEVIREAKYLYCGKADDVDELVNNIERFMENAEKEQMELNAKAFYESYFERQKFMNMLEEELDR